jgi:NAD(P)-dependent dehydrogenase (short-subunit alcohol dehydrogenase family)
MRNDLPNRFTKVKIMSKNDQWTANDIPDQSGRVVIVTGANSGIGYETARALAQKGATVIMACRSIDKANEAVTLCRAEEPQGGVEVMQLDLGDLDSVQGFAEGFKDQYDRLDLLINNAGIMQPPFGLTEQKFETQFGVNHLGHFALTGLLLDVVMRTPGSRIVTVSSTMHKYGKIDFDNLNAESGYSATSAYGQSKLANLLFTYELQRKLEDAGSDTIATAAHPGWTETNLQRHSGGVRFLNRFLAQTPEMGALPTLRAATDPDARGGSYYGPSNRFESAGYPKQVKSNARSHDSDVAQRLWTVSEEMTGVRYSFDRHPVSES